MHRSPIHLLSGGSHKAGQGCHTRRHNHSHWELVYYRQGQVRYQIEGTESASAWPGIIWLTPPGQHHTEEAISTFANYYIHFTCPPEIHWPERLHDDADGSLGQICASVVRELSGKMLDREVMLDCLGQQLFIALRRSSTQTLPEPAERLVLAAENLLRDVLHENPNLTTLAQTLAVAPSTLRAAFQRVRKCSPRQVLQTLRAEQALALIRSTTLPLDTVAQRCGYDSASHLSRWIRRLYGMSPGALRGKTLAFP